MKKTPRQIRDELLSTLLALEESYMSSPAYTDTEKRISYRFLEQSEFLLNEIKALEYHYRDDSHNGRTKKLWSEAMKNAHKALKKYAENSEPENDHSKLQLKLEFDDQRYLEHRHFLHKK